MYICAAPYHRHMFIDVYVLGEKISCRIPCNDLIFFIYENTNISNTHNRFWGQSNIMSSFFFCFFFHKWNNYHSLGAWLTESIHYIILQSNLSVRTTRRKPAIIKVVIVKVKSQWLVSSYTHISKQHEHAHHQHLTSSKGGQIRTTFRYVSFNLDSSNISVVFSRFIFSIE